MYLWLSCRDRGNPDVGRQPRMPPQPQLSWWPIVCWSPQYSFLYHKNYLLHTKSSQDHKGLVVLEVLLGADVRSKHRAVGGVSECHFLSSLGDCVRNIFSFQCLARTFLDWIFVVEVVWFFFSLKHNPWLIVIYGYMCKQQFHLLAVCPLPPNN